MAVSSIHPSPRPGVARTTLVKDFLTALGWDAAQETGYALFSGPEIVSSPDRAVFITPTGGPGWVTEEAALDAWSFQARVRGAEDDPDGAALAAQQLDWYLLTAGAQAVDNVWIACVTRSGGAPAVLPLDPQDRRFEYTCTYIITTGGG